MKLVILDYNTSKVHVYNNMNKKKGEKILKTYDNNAIEYIACCDDEFEIVYYDN